MATVPTISPRRFSPEWLPLLAKVQRQLNDLAWAVLFSREPDDVRRRAKAILEDADAVAEHIAGDISLRYTRGEGESIEQLIESGIAKALATPARSEGAGG